MSTVFKQKAAMWRNVFHILVLLCLLIATVSCSIKESVKKCSFKVEKIAINDFTNQGFKAVVKFKIKNPNWFGMKVKQLEYFVSVNDEELGKGKSESSISIPARSKSYVDVPLQMQFTELSGSLLKLFISGKMEYRIRGKAVFATILGDMEYPFDLKKKVKDFNKKKA